MTDKNSSGRKFGAFGVSIFIHGAILLAIATMTVQLTMPEGDVSYTMDFTPAPSGAQLTTPNVSPEPVAEIPQKAKPKPAPPPLPVAKKAEPVPDVPDQPSIVPTPMDDGTMDVVQDRPEYAQHETTTTTLEEPPPVVAKAIVAPVPQPEEAPQEEEKPQDPTPAPVAAKTEQEAVSGEDVADLKAQDRAENQNYGRADQLKVATDVLNPIAGNKKPAYPWMARLKRKEGQGLATFYVNERGEVSQVQIAQSSGEEFSKSAIEAFQTWRFIPPVQAGYYAQPFQFRLAGQEKEKPTLLRRK